jgi:hypothetical protein
VRRRVIIITTNDQKTDCDHRINYDVIVVRYLWLFYFQTDSRTRTIQFLRFAFDYYLEKNGDVPPTNWTVGANGCPFQKTFSAEDVLAIEIDTRVFSVILETDTTLYRPAFVHKYWLKTINIRPATVIAMTAYFKITQNIRQKLLFAASFSRRSSSRCCMTISRGTTNSCLQMGHVFLIFDQAEMQLLQKQCPQDRGRNSCISLFSKHMTHSIEIRRVRVTHSIISGK